MHVFQNHRGCGTLHGDPNLRRMASREGRYFTMIWGFKLVGTMARLRKAYPAALVGAVVLFAGIQQVEAVVRPIRILALGTSLTQGYGLPPGTDMPTLLENRLRADHLDVTVINAGVSGDTTAGGLARVDW